MNRIAIVVLAVCALLAGHAAPVDSQSRKRCPAGKLVDQDRGGRVVKTGRADENYWVCLRGRRPYLLAVSSPNYDVQDVRLASPYVAYRLSIVTTVGSGDEVILVNARRPRGEQGSGLTSVDGESLALVVSKRGVALSLESGSEGRPRQLRRFDVDDAASLDTGAIDPASLAISRDGRRAYWLRDGVPQTAAL